MGQRDAEAGSTAHVCDDTACADQDEERGSDEFRRGSPESPVIHV